MTRAPQAWAPQLTLAQVDFEADLGESRYKLLQKRCDGSSATHNRSVIQVPSLPFELGRLRCAFVSGPVEAKCKPERTQGVPLVDAGLVMGNEVSLAVQRARLFINTMPTSCTLPGPWRGSSPALQSGRHC